MGRPRTGKNLRSGKVMISVEPEILSDFKTVAFLENTTMTEKITQFMENEINKKQAEIQAFKKIQAGNI